ncbi:cache domain-containing sensor histidine kinase [Derxia lacustris]|uniref:cache domain-containing sensor histidine kinase n=1 Tax=Derxia lacustris TaxID=764842 RepID=UPI000A17379C|nr:ATP-binding protein [Derxia lacustris]
MRFRFRLQSAVAALSLTLLAGLWLAFFVQMDHEREVAVSNARRDIRNLVLAFAEHTDRTIQGADQAARFVRHQIVEHQGKIDLEGFVRDGLIVDPMYNLITWVGADGFVVKSSQNFKRVDLSDREHIRVQLDAPVGSDKLFFSKPVLGRVSKKWSLQLTRRIANADGSAAGVIVVSLTPDYFTGLYANEDLGAGSVMALVGGDGIVRAQAGGSRVVLGENVGDSAVFRRIDSQATGETEGDDFIDGTRRLYAFATQPETGVSVVLGVDEATVLAPWVHRRDLGAASLAAITLVGLALTALVIRQASAQDRLVTALRESQRRANEANELKSKFLASVSHELRTPLNGILGYAELIRDTAPDDDMREMGDIVHQSATHLHALVNSILDLAKIEAGRMDLQEEDFLLGPLFERVTTLNDVAARGKGLALVTEIDPVLAAPVHADQMKLFQVLNNLVNNAVKFSERGSIRLAARPVGEGRLRIDVSDDGVGIPRESLARIFDRFQGTSNDFVHPQQGAGLGLPLAKEFIEMMHGSISIDSDRDAGTRICIELPLVLAPRPAVVAQEVAHV